MNLATLFELPLANKGDLLRLDISHTGLAADDFIVSAVDISFELHMVSEWREPLPGDGGVSGTIWG